MDRDEIRKEVWGKNLTVLERVEFILEHFPKTRDDERLLVEVYYNVFHQRQIPQWILYGGLDEFIPKIHSVRRMARKIQNTFKKFPPSQKQQEVRAELSAFHRSFHE